MIPYIEYEVIMAEQKETKNPVQSAERIFQVMEMLADHGEMGLCLLYTSDAADDS